MTIHAERKMPWTIAGKTVMITGATAGIGRVTARELARMGANLVLVCRNRARGEETVREIRAAAGNEEVELMIADLASRAEIRRLAEGFLATRRPLHVLVNNAGIFNLRRETTADGIEAVFAVNHLAYFLLTSLLLDRLRESAPARIVNVASDAHHWGTIDFADLQAERRYRSMGVYGRSKLANILFTYELAKRLEGSGVTVNCLHPGAVGTQLGSNNGWIARVLLPLLRPLMRTPEHGAETSIHLASSPEVEGVSGRYFVDRREKRSSPESYDAEVARRLWETSERMTGLASAAGA
jgi:NAD(P)-dependent dehydrogenase (short-subunit alcohol dehydrogenase family)